MGFERTLGPGRTKTAMGGLAPDPAATIVDDAPATFRSTPRMGSMLPSETPSPSSPPSPKQPPAAWKQPIAIAPRRAPAVREHPSSRPPPPISVAPRARAHVAHWVAIAAGAALVLLSVGLTLALVRTPSHAAAPTTSAPPPSAPSVGVWTVDDAPGVAGETKTAASAAPSATTPSPSASAEGPPTIATSAAKPAIQPAHKSLPATAQTSR
jgi:hypothetical protein